MNANLDKIAKELYGKIQTRFPSIKIGDENATVLSKKEDIPNARFFEFEYEEGNVPLGTIAITLDATDGIIVQVSGDLVNDGSNGTYHNAYKFIRSFRQFAKDRLLNFDIQNIGKSNLDKRDYEFQAKKKEPTIMENKLFGTSKISYQNLGEARLIIKHSQHINPDLAAGRTMHIESIYIENADGERFKYPFKHLNGARALAEHVKNGGNPYDSIGKYVTGLSEELAHLRKFKGYVTRQPMVSEAMGTVTDRVIERMEQIKKEIQHLQRPAFYQEFAENFMEKEEVLIPEEMVNNLIDRLTVRTFNEELKAVFPYIYNLIDESDIPVCDLTSDDLLSETRCPDCYQDPCVCEDMYDDQIKENFSELDNFETFMEAITDGNGLFSPNREVQQTAIDELNDLLSSELTGGPNGVNAIDSLKGIIDDPEFLDELANIDPDLDVRPLIQQFVQHVDPDVADQLEFGEGDVDKGEEELPPPEPEELPPAPEEELPPPPVAEPAPAMAPAAPAPVAPAPMAETNSLRAKFIKAVEAGATLDTVLEFGYKSMTLGEAIAISKLTPAECGIMGKPEGYGESPDGLTEMLKFISGFYNKEDKTFPLGGQRIKIKVKKDFEDGMFPNASPEDLIKVLKFIDMKDPSSAEQNDIVRLAGIQK